MALTEKQKRFVAEYLIDLNATQAAIRAGYSEKTASRIGPELLGKTCVSTAVQAAVEERQARTGITQDWVLEELRRIASANGADFAKVVGRTVELTDTDDLPPEKKAAISGIKETKFGIEVATYDKVRALELLGKHLGLFEKAGNTGEQDGIDAFVRATRPTGKEMEVLYAEKDDERIPI